MKIIVSTYLIISSLLFLTASKSMMVRVDYTSKGDFYKCYRELGLDQIFLYYEQDPYNESVTDILSAKNAGLKVHIGYFSCRKDDAETIARQIRKSFGINIIQRIYLLLKVQDASKPQCNWDNYSPQSNCRYLQELILILQKFGYSANVGTNKYAWLLAFRQINYCPEVANTLLWWLPTSEDQSRKPDFANYKQIGGWQKPFMKLFRQTRVCNEDMEQCYYE